MHLEASHAGRRYGDFWAVHDISITIPSGKSLLLLGPSGGGKSTLLRLLAGLEIPDEGSILLDRNPLPHEESKRRVYRRRLGFVFQEGNLFPHLTAMQNITLPLTRVHHFTKEKAEERASQLLHRFSLLHRAHYRPAELSGGQRQRVALARALGHNPEILFLDEPTSALDPEMTAEVLEALEKVLADGMTLVLATHATHFAKRTGGEVAFLKDHHLEWTGSTQEFFTQPPTPGAKSYLSRVLREME